MSADVQFSAPKKVKTKKKVITFVDVHFSAQKQVKIKKKVITFADRSLP